MNSAALWTVTSHLFLTLKRRPEDNGGLQKAPQCSLRKVSFPRLGKVLRGTDVKAGLLVSGHTEMREEWAGWALADLQGLQGGT